MNELHEEFRSRGLSIIGVTDEGKSLTEDWIEAQRARYGYAYDKSGQAKRFFGVRGIPHAILVDPTGRIVWRGHPAKLDRALLEPYLEGAIAVPVWDLPKSARDVRKALEKRKFAAALEAATEMGEEGAGLRESLATLIANRLERLEEAFAAGDFRTALMLADRMSEELAGLEAGTRATEIAKGIGSDKQAKAVLKAQEQVAEMRAEMREVEKKKEADRLVTKLEKIEAECDGSMAATQARALREEILTLRRKLK